jgi:hypothetical protein
VAMLDHLLEQGSKVVLVECDTSNPDVWKAYREQVETELINLDEADGWIHLVNTCDRHREGVVVINTAARNNLAVKQYGRTLDRRQVDHAAGPSRPRRRRHLQPAHLAQGGGQGAPHRQPRGAREVARRGPEGPRRSLAVSLEETFAKVVGRHASDEERQRLYRLRDALGLRDNDAFWSIVMALESTTRSSGDTRPS